MIQSIEKGRKDDGNRSIADKIIKRFHDIEMTAENNHGRWAWELLQNAKDCVAENNRKISVEIELSEGCVVFRHNGTHFTEKDIRGLINQISSKEVEEGEESKQTGKFGTGFLTTHLLSKIIQVESIVETVDAEFFRFAFPLDRNGKTTFQLVPKIENAWIAFHKSTEGNQIDDYDEDDFNTLFTYNLETEEQQYIARIGVNEFSRLIPFVLAFIPTIESVKIIDNIKNSETKFENNNEPKDEILLSINKTENKKKSKIKLLFAKDDDVAIASIVEPNETGYKIQNLKDFPKLFCDFPLIGTENFHFPMIVNSFYFNPLIERDGVWLKGDGKKEVEENRELLEKAVSLYKQLLEKITALDFCEYHNICLSKVPNTNEKYFDEKWYKNNIQKLLREIILKSDVIETVKGDKVAIDKGKGTVNFPNAEKKIDREKIWQLCNIGDFFILPKKEHIHFWYDLIWDNNYYCDEYTILLFIQTRKNIEKLQESLGDIEVLEWLNDVFAFTLNYRDSYKIFDLCSVIPNQEGVFKKRLELSKDKIENETLKQIASLLDYNYYEDLIHKDIFFEDSYSTTTKQDVAIQITSLIKDKDRNSLISADYILAIRKLTEWFENNPEKGKTLFTELYKKKEKLFVDTIDDKENLYRVLTSKTPLSKLAEIAKAIENDPEILNIIARRQREQEEEKERNELGEQVEKVLAEVLEQHDFEVKKEIFGKDLVITLKKNNAKYYIEVKSTSRESYVSMTPYQVKTSVAYSDNYALCVVHKNGSVVNEDYIKNNAKFVIDIGDKLHSKFDEVSEFETNKTEIANTHEDIDLFYENNLEYKYKISSNIWTRGQNFWDFIEHINDL